MEYLVEAKQLINDLSDQLSYYETVAPCAEVAAAVQEMYDVSHNEICELIDAFKTFRRGTAGTSRLRSVQSSLTQLNIQLESILAACQGDYNYSRYYPKRSSSRRRYQDSRFSRWGFGSEYAAPTVPVPVVTPAATAPVNATAPVPAAATLLPPAAPQDLTPEVVAAIVIAKKLFAEQIENPDVRPYSNGKDMDVKPNAVGGGTKPKTSRGRLVFQAGVAGSIVATFVSWLNRLNPRYYQAAGTQIVCEGPPASLTSLTTRVQGNRGWYTTDVRDREWTGVSKYDDQGQTLRYKHGEKTGVPGVLETIGDAVKSLIPVSQPRELYRDFVLEVEAGGRRFLVSHEVDGGVTLTSGSTTVYVDPANLPLGPVAIPNFQLLINGYAVTPKPQGDGSWAFGEIAQLGTTNTVAALQKAVLGSAKVLKDTLVAPPANTGLTVYQLPQDTGKAYHALQIGAYNTANDIANLVGETSATAEVKALVAANTQDVLGLVEKTANLVKGSSEVPQTILKDIAALVEPTQIVMDAVRTVTDDTAPSSATIAPPPVNDQAVAPYTIEATPDKTTVADVPVAILIDAMPQTLETSYGPGEVAKIADAFNKNKGVGGGTHQDMRAFLQQENPPAVGGGGMLNNFVRFLGGVGAPQAQAGVQDQLGGPVNVGQVGGQVEREVFV